MRSAVKERLISFLKYKKIGQVKFAAMVGLSRGYVNNIVNTIGPDALSKIAVAFPDLNTAWLLTGEGEMLTGSPEKQRAAEAVDAVSIPADAWQLIRQQVADNQKRTEQMDRLIALLEQWSGRYDRMSDRLDHLSEAVSVSFRPFEGIRTNLDIQNPPRKTRHNTLIISKKRQLYIAITAKENTIKS